MELMELGVGCKVILTELPEGYNPTPLWPLWESEYGCVGTIVQMRELSTGMYAVVRWSITDVLCNITHLSLYLGSMDDLCGKPGVDDSEINPNRAFLNRRAERPR